MYVKYRLICEKKPNPVPLLIGQCKSLYSTSDLSLWIWFFLQSIKPYNRSKVVEHQLLQKCHQSIVNS